MGPTAPASDTRWSRPLRVSTVWMAARTAGSRPGHVRAARTYDPSTWATEFGPLAGDGAASEWGSCTVSGADAATRPSFGLADGGRSQEMSRAPATITIDRMPPSSVRRHIVVA